MRKPEISPELLAGVWSATPTPLLKTLRIDTASLKRMVDHHLRLGVKGLLLAGTCGEGPWVPEREKRLLVQTVARCAEGRLLLAVQVTDNSAERIFDNIHSAEEDGADIAVIAPPYFLMNATPRNLLRLYQQAIRDSPLPVGLYDRGRFGSVVIPERVLGKLYEEQNVILIKDSSLMLGHRKIALAAKRKRPELILLNGAEFNCVEYLEAGFDGLLLGGGIFTGHLARSLMEAVAAGNLTLARKLQRRMNRMMYAVYGGKQLRCWLSGLKWLLVQMGIFRTWNSFLNYPLTPSCVRGIRQVLKEDADVLLA